VKDDSGEDRFSRRTKTLDVRPLGDGRFAFESSLVDRSFGGRYEIEDVPSVVVHQFVIEGIVDAELALEALRVRAEEHPFPQCPLIIPATRKLLGLRLTSSWRRNVLDRFGGSAGCTHVTTLLLGLSEVTTLIYFQQSNEHAAYGPIGRASGAWVADSLDLGQSLGDACHVLAKDGQVLKRAEHFRGSVTPARQRDRQHVYRAGADR
jgi:hypothetical protein